MTIVVASKELAISSSSRAVERTPGPTSPSAARPPARNRSTPASTSCPPPSPPPRQGDGRLRGSAPGCRHHHGGRPLQVTDMSDEYVRLEGLRQLARGVHDPPRAIGVVIDRGYDPFEHLASPPSCRATCIGRVTINHNLYVTVKHTIYPAPASVACYPRL